MQTARRKH